MFSKVSRLFFKENQGIRYTFTENFLFQLNYDKFSSIFKGTFSNIKLRKNA